MEINDLKLLEEIKNLIDHDGDVRPVWVGPKLAKTENTNYQNLAKWANEHWGLYRGFIPEIKKNEAIILDLGCGCGFCTINLSESFENSQIIGYDLDEKSISFAKKFNSNKKTLYFNENILDSNLPECDFIFLIETLEHIKHSFHFQLIDKCIGSLRKDGLLFISTPNENNFSDGERGHIGILTPKYFEMIKEKYKTNIVDIKYFDNKKLLNNIDDFISVSPTSHYKITLQKT